MSKMPRAVASVAALAFGAVDPTTTYEIVTSTGPLLVTGQQLLARVEAGLHGGLDLDFWAKVEQGGRTLPVAGLAATGPLGTAAQGLPSLAFTGGQGSGKTTLAEFAQERLGYVRFSWATPVRQVAALAYGPIDKGAVYEVARMEDGERVDKNVTGREILQWLGTDAIRDRVDQDFWVRAGALTLATADPRIRFANDDTRFPNESEALARQGFLIVQCAASEASRRARVEGSFGDPNHPSEQGYQRMTVDITVDTDHDAEFAWRSLTDQIRARSDQAA